MRFFVKGFAWDVAAPRAGQPRPSRADAEAALIHAPRLATSTSHYREAQAAFSVGDYGHVLSCLDAAEEAVLPERWS